MKNVLIGLQQVLIGIFELLTFKSVTIYARWFEIALGVLTWTLILELFLIAVF